MRIIARIISTSAGIGYSPIAPGTGGSLVGALLAMPLRETSIPIGISILIIITLIGIAASGITEKDLGIHDPSCVVIDEVIGMLWILFFLPSKASVSLIAASFFLFRAADIIKPPPIKRLAQARGGWGIVLDDLGASAYVIAILICALRILALK